MVVLAVVLVGFLPEVSMGLFSAMLATTSALAKVGPASVNAAVQAGEKGVEKIAKSGPVGKSSSGFTGISSGIAISIQQSQ